MKKVVLCNGVLVLVVLAAGCSVPATKGSDLKVVAEFCETAVFEHTEDFALHYQIANLPETVERSLFALRNAGSTEHTKYLCYLLLREYEKQLEQFDGYSLGPALPTLVVQEIDRVLREAGTLSGVSEEGDHGSATYAKAILDNPRLIADYPKALVLAQKIAADSEKP